MRRRACASGGRRCCARRACGVTAGASRRPLAGWGTGRRAGASAAAAGVGSGELAAPGASGRGVGGSRQQRAACLGAGQHRRQDVHPLPRAPASSSSQASTFSSAPRCAADPPPRPRPSCLRARPAGGGRPRPAGRPPSPLARPLAAPLTACPAPPLRPPNSPAPAGGGHPRQAGAHHRHRRGLPPPQPQPGVPAGERQPPEGLQGQPGEPPPCAAAAAPRRGRQRPRAPARPATPAARSCRRAAHPVPPPLLTCARAAHALPPQQQVVFPRRAGKPKAGDSAASDLSTAQQLKGKLLPIAKPAAALEKVAVTADMQVGAAWRAWWALASGRAPGAGRPRGAAHPHRREPRRSVAVPCAARVAARTPRRPRPAPHASPPPSIHPPSLPHLSTRHRRRRRAPTASCAWSA